MNFRASHKASRRRDFARLGLMGLLPSGLNYSVNGSYARSEGKRNFMQFE